MSVRSRSIGVFALALLGLDVGACVTEDVGLGDAVSSVSFAECYGAATNCNGAEVDASPLLDQEPPFCTLEQGPQRAVAWTAQLEAPVFAAAVDRDSVLWVASVDDASQATVARYASSGEVISQLTLDLRKDRGIATNASLQLVVDIDGHAYLGAEITLADESTNWTEVPILEIYELDESSAPVGEPIVVEGMTEALRLGTSTDGSLVVSAADASGGAALGRFAPDNTLIWVQTNSGSGLIERVSGAGDEATVVLARVPAEMPVDGEQHVVLYDAQGNRAWARTVGDTMFLDVDAAQDGIVLSGQRIDLSGTILVKLDVAAEVQWALALDTQTAEPTPTTSDADGNLYVADLGAWTVADTETDAFIVIDPDGERCTRSVIANVPQTDTAMVHVLAAPDGTIFFYTQPVDSSLSQFAGALAP